MAGTATVISSFPFCEDNLGFSGAAEVVEVVLEDGHKTIGMRLRVGNHFVRVPRHRVEEVIRALQQAEVSAAQEYGNIIKEMKT
jgi:hypothetical protein